MKKGIGERNLAILAIISVIIAGVLGIFRETGGIENEIASIIPEGTLAQPKGEGRFMVFNNESELPIGYITIEISEGYSGDLVAAVLVDTLGIIGDLKVVRHRETPSFMEKVVRKGLLKRLAGISYSQSFELGKGVDIVSGATYTSEAIIECAKMGSRHVAESELGLEIPVEDEARFTVEIPEIALVLLYVIALIGIYTHFRYKKMLLYKYLFHE